MDGDVPTPAVRLFGREPGELVPAPVEEVLWAVGQAAPREHGQVVEHPARIFSVGHGHCSTPRCKCRAIAEPVVRTVPFRSPKRLVRGLLWRVCEGGSWMT